MKVKLLAHSPQPEKLIAMATKLCYSPAGVDEIEKVEEAKKLFIESIKRGQEDYDRLVDMLFEKHYKELLAQDKNQAKSQAEKIIIEDVRYVFHNACETKMIFTINVRSLYNFFEHRCCER